MQDIASTDNLDRVYYVTEPRNATVRELWRMSPPTFRGKLDAILVKMLRLTSPPQIGMALDDVVRCSTDEIPELWEISGDTIRHLEQLGFTPTLATRLPTIGEGSCCSLIFLGKEPTLYAVIVCSKARSNSQDSNESALSFVSRDAKKYWVTSGGVKRLNSPPTFDVQYFQGSSAEFLYTTHLERNRAVAPESLQIFDTDSLWATLCETEAQNARFGVERGVLRPMANAEVKAVVGWLLKTDARSGLERRCN